jgi:hypothetical protein
MAVITILEFPGVTREVYERAGASLAGGAPAGILYHACGPTEDGWRIFGIWETQAAFDAFTDGVYIPALRAQGGSRPSRREVTHAYHAGPVTQT